jgi:hypothetical protein
MIPAPPPTSTEDVIVNYLVRLITLCEQEGFDIDLLYHDAWFIYRGEPESGT